MKNLPERAEAVVTALLFTVSNHFRLFDQIKRENLNTSDASSGMAADIECWRENKIRLIVEVKDQKLSLTQVENKLESARVRKISEIVFIAQKGIYQQHKEKITRKIAQEFISGQNIYVTDVFEFSYGIHVVRGTWAR